MRLLVPAESVNIHVLCGHNIIYDMTLSTEKQRRHMINVRCLICESVTLLLLLQHG